MVKNRGLAYLKLIPGPRATINQVGINDVGWALAIQLESNIALYALFTDYIEKLKK
jgi:hypothetical protein